MVVLDSGSERPTEGAHGPTPLILHWAARDVPEGEISLPGCVDAAGDRLRDAYLSWSYRIGQTVVAGKSIHDHLRPDEGPSLWWFNTLTDKSPHHSLDLFNLLKLWELDRVFQEQRISYRRHKAGNQKLGLRMPSRETLAQALPHPLGALFKWARFIWSSRKQLLRPSPAVFQEAPEQQGVVISYFPNHDDELANKGTYRSNYFGPLHPLLEQTCSHLHWMLIHFHNSTLNQQQAGALLERFEKQADGRARFNYLEDFITLGSLGRALRLYLWQWRQWMRMGAIRDHFILPGSTLNFWPLMAYEWRKSLYGHTAVDTCLRATAIQIMVEKLNPPRFLLHVWENMGWEKYLNGWIHQRFPNCRTIGMQHTTVLYFDWRHFEAKETYRLPAYQPLMPDGLALNGMAARRRLTGIGFPTQRMHDVEALRFFSLLEVPERSTEATPQMETLLVITGYLDEENRQQLELLAAALMLQGQQEKEQFQRIIIKPHPAVPVTTHLERLGLLPAVELSSEPLGEMWPLATAVYAANSTSACVEAAWMGLPLLIPVGPDGFNLNPLLAEPGISPSFVQNARELTQEMRRLLRHEVKTIAIKRNFFYLDKALPRWQKLLETL